MINTVGLLLRPYTEFELSPKVCVDDIVQHWRYLRGNGPYFPYLELLPDEKLKELEIEVERIRKAYESTFGPLDQKSEKEVSG